MKMKVLTPVNKFEKYIMLIIATPMTMPQSRNCVKIVADTTGLKLLLYLRIYSS